MGKTNKHYI